MTLREEYKQDLHDYNMIHALVEGSRDFPSYENWLENKINKLKEFKSNNDNIRMERDEAIRRYRKLKDPDFISVPKILSDDDCSAMSLDDDEYRTMKGCHSDLIRYFIKKEQ